ncbi:hypothetical protein MuYL_4714 [Mucilaginibacter xinganensis]|uniref:Uncharacterized protein n=2 Tax=Mucilaginibacter xinganensis TaxID=1234841 RepID=A0A223P3B5_9SPHI|nr:hypothetical protein MuYL_4714 [Mucilaginibacter xinganensis]
MCFAVNLAFAQTDTIRLKDKRLLTSVLKPGLKQYLVYFQTPASPKTLRFWFWLRDIKTESRGGEKVFTITQHWYGNDTTSYREVYSVNKAADFAPVYHSETVKNIKSAYNWHSDKITGADTVKGNAKKDFSLAFNTPNFNWNLDIETFEMLPLAAGKTFAINFYDAGLDPPKYILYKVSGSEIVATLNDEKIDCWKLLTEGDYSGGHFSQTFWISKKGHEFLKEEDAFNGGYRYKVKMAQGAIDLMPRFKK